MGHKRMFPQQSKPVTIWVRVSEPMGQAIDQARERLEPKPNRSEWIRTAVEAALKAQSITCEEVRLADAPAPREPGRPAGRPSTWTF